jgi:imidazolonepropionase-like amidohydrolase
VVFEDGVIKEVGRGAKTASGIRIDCAGRAVMPGLIDAHVHLCSVDVEVQGEQRRYPTSLLAMYIARNVGEALSQGFTTVRDAGGADWGLKAAVEKGLIPGPRLLVSGRMLSETGGHGDMRARAECEEPCRCGGHIGMLFSIADGVDEVRGAVREELRRGADQIKVMAGGGVASPTDRLESVQYSREELQVAVQEASAAGTYVLAHAYTPEAIRNCVETGVRSVEHGNLLDEETARLMAERGVYLVTNFIAYEMLHREGEAAGMPREKLDKLALLYDRGVEALKIAQRAGVKLASGSDLLGPLAAHRTEELAIKSRVLGPMGALVSTTKTNADLLRLGGECGTLSPGKRADLLVVDGNPAVSVDVLADRQKVVGIVKGGVFVKRQW